MTEEQARQIFRQAEAAVVFALLQLAKQLQQAQAGPALGPSTPSGMKPVYQKPPAESAGIIRAGPEGYAVSPSLHSPQHMEDLNLTGTGQQSQADSYGLHLEGGFAKLASLGRTVGTTKGNEMQPVALIGWGDILGRHQTEPSDYDFSEHALGSANRFSSLQVMHSEGFWQAEFYGQ